MDLLLTVTAAQVRLTGAGHQTCAPVMAGCGRAWPRRSTKAAGPGPGLGLPARAEAGPRPAAGAAGAGPGGPAAGRIVPARPGRAASWAGCWRRRSGRISRCGSAWRCRRSWPGCRGRRCPGPDGRGPLALHPLVSLYRKADAAAARVLPGPLRIVVAIASPDTGGGAVLDYERELRNVLAAVRAARQDAADVRVVPFATPAAIREELDRGPAHVLHISGHGAPGLLQLENEDGSARPVTAGRVPGPGDPAGPDAAGDHLGGLLHRRRRQRGRGLVRGPAVRARARRR